MLSLMVCHARCWLLVAECRLSVMFLKGICKRHWRKCGQDGGPGEVWVLSRQQLGCHCSGRCVGGLQAPGHVTAGAETAKSEALMVAGTLPAVPGAVQSSCLFKGSEWGEGQPLSCEGWLEPLAWSSSPIDMRLSGCLGVHLKPYQTHARVTTSVGRLG